MDLHLGCHVQGSQLGEENSNLCAICKASHIEKDLLASLAALACAQGDVAIDNSTSDLLKSAQQYCSVPTARLLG